MKALQFYTATGMRDAERVNSWSGLLCPDWRVLPFQIQRPATMPTGLTEALLVDCAGNTTNILSDLTLETNEKTTYDFITYKGEAFATFIDYGVYYIQASDGNSVWYSEWLDVKNIQPTLLSYWVATGYTTFARATGGSYEDVSITNAVTLAPSSAVSNPLSVQKGERFHFTYGYSIISGAPGATIAIVDSGGTVISDTITLSTALPQTLDTITARATDSAAELKLSNDSGRFTVSRLSLRRHRGNESFVYIKYDNTKDIQGKTTLDYALTPERESILYASGWAQEIYLNTYLNNPQHEIIEIGEEKNGYFEAEKIVDKYLYNIVSYESRSVFNALRLLPLHDTIQIYDEVGNFYNVDQGNIRVGKDEDTFDTWTLRIDFNEDNDVWTNSMDNIV
jgi:hypothetical protein